MLPDARTPDEILQRAHTCVIDAVGGALPSPDDGMGPAPSSRLALFQMLARYEDEVDLQQLLERKRTR